MQEFKRKHGMDLTSSPRALRRLRTACERAKISLSSGVTASIDLEHLFEGRFSRAAAGQPCSLREASEGSQLSMAWFTVDATSPYAGQGVFSSSASPTLSLLSPSAEAFTCAPPPVWLQARTSSPPSAALASRSCAWTCSPSAWSRW